MRETQSHQRRGLDFGIIDSGKRPLGMAGDDRVLRTRQLFERRNQFRIAGIPHRHRYVSQKAGIAGAGDRGATKQVAKVGFR